MTRPRVLILLALGVLFGAAAPARAQSPPPATLEVTKLPGWQARVCWSAVAGANIYSVRYRINAGVVFEVLRVPSTAPGTVCATVSFSQNDDYVFSCTNHEVSVAAGTASGNSATFGSPSLPHPLPFNTVFDDPTAPVPWCDFADAFVTDRRANLAPSLVSVTDTSGSNPTLKLGVTCPGITPTGYKTTTKSTRAPRRQMARGAPG